jgi:hypothetical protein
MPKNGMSIGVIISGDPGHGKTETALRFVVPGKKKTKRLVLDYEARSTQYQAEKDDCERHLWAFDIYPEPFATPDAIQLASLYKSIVEGKLKADVFIIDNVVLFQDELSLVCSNKDTAKMLAIAFGVYDRYRLFIEHNFKVGDAAWWGLVKAIIKQLLLACRRKRINVVVTTELKNVWQDYGSRDRNRPAKILGQTAKLLRPWLQILDTVWVLSRKEKDVDGKPQMRAAPRVSIDAFSPKASLVGIPPLFDFTDWKQIWRWIEERGVPQQEDFAKVEVQEEQVYMEEEAAKPQPGGDGDGQLPPLKRWQDFLERIALSHAEALKLLAAESVNAWINAEEGRDLSAAIVAVGEALRKVEF